MGDIDFKTYDDGDDIVSEKVNKVSALIVGLTGSGKSSIIKSISSSEHSANVITKMSARSVTKNIQFYEGNAIINPKNPLDKYVVDLFDTVGLGDNDINVSRILREIVDCMPKNMAKIHKVVFCFKMDRLRIKMSEELNILYNFFRLMGAKPQNFVICLTFCDFLHNDTIRSFWADLKNNTNLEMVKEVPTVIFTSFPNLSECDTDNRLVSFITDKVRASRLRIFDNVIAKQAEPFYPYDYIVKMPLVDFDNLCSLLGNYRSTKHWWWALFQNSDQDEIIKRLKMIRNPNPSPNPTENTDTKTDQMTMTT